MAAPGPAYVVRTGSVALSTTAKSVINLIPGATYPIVLTEISCSVDAASGRCHIELCESTQAGTGTSSSGTVKQVRGFVAGDTTAPGSTVNINYTAEPTTLTALKDWWFPAPGPFVIQLPLGREVQSLVSGATKYKGLVMRLTVDTGTPNGYAYFEWEE